MEPSERGEEEEAKSEEVTVVAIVEESPELDIGKIWPGSAAEPGIDKPSFCQQIETVVCWEG